MKTLRLNIFVASFLTAFSLFVVFIAYGQFFELNLITGLIFFVVILPIVTNLSSIFFSSSKNLGVAICGTLLFYAFMIFMTYKTDLFILMRYAIVPSMLLLILYNIRQIPFARRRSKQLH